MPCNHAFSSDYEGFGAFFYSKKGQDGNTVFYR